MVSAPPMCHREGKSKCAANAALEQAVFLLYPEWWTRIAEAYCPSLEGATPVQPTDQIILAINSITFTLTLCLGSC
jgi:hypothetical protein